MSSSNRPCYLPLLWAMGANDRSARVGMSEGGSEAGLLQQQTDGGSMAATVNKILLLRNEKTGAWKYKHMHPSEYKDKSWPGYEYYGFHKDVRAAMDHAGKINAVMKQKHDESTGQPPVALKAAPKAVQESLHPRTQHLFAGSCCDDVSEYGG